MEAPERLAEWIFKDFQTHHAPLAIRVLELVLYGNYFLI